MYDDWAEVWQLGLRIVNLLNEIEQRPRVLRNGFIRPC